MKVLIIFWLCLYVSDVCGLKILAIFPYTGKSHHFVVDPFCDALAHRGHEITVVSHFPSRNPPKTRRDVKLTCKTHVGENRFDLKDFDGIPPALSWLLIATECNFLYDFGYEMCENILNHSEIQEMIKGGEKFDVAILEQFNSDCLLGVAHKLGAQSIGITSDTMFPWHFNRIGAISNPAFVPNHNLGYGNNPTFLETTSSVFVSCVMKIGYYFRSVVPTQRLLRRHFGEDFPSLEELTNGLKMMMTNSYFPLHGAFQTAPNLVEVGGLHLGLKNSSSKLTPEIEKYMNEAKHGVIFFSLGSMIRGSTLPPEKLRAFLDAFAELPQRVLWKWEEESMPGIPKNVMLKKWLPQFDILNHKNIKAFFSHGGMLSTTEAAHCGVPMVAMPFYGDQFANAAAVEDSGLGVVLSYQDVTKESVLAAINKVLDPKSQESAKRLSAIWRDRPMSPLDTAVYWVEHVARHGGHHLRPTSADLPLYRYLLLDVLAFLTLIGFILAFIVYKLVFCTLKLCFRPKNAKAKMQ